jgi:hypothetical protein
MACRAVERRENHEEPARRNADKNPNGKSRFKAFEMIKILWLKLLITAIFGWGVLNLC